MRARNVTESITMESGRNETDNRNLRSGVRSMHVVRRPIGGAACSEHIMLDPSELTWNDLSSLPGVKIAVIEGALNQAASIMFRLKFPANFKVPPHWHPGIEHITIISGTLHMGIGSVFDPSKTRA